MPRASSISPCLPTRCGRAGVAGRCRRERSRAVPVTIPSDDRSPIARAYHWASRIMLVSLEMVLPGIAGYWLDQWLGTKVLFTLAGFAFGCSAATVHLIQLTRSVKNRPIDD